MGPGLAAIFGGRWAVSVLKRQGPSRMIREPYLKAMFHS